jgi:hypothetical protein
MEHRARSAEANEKDNDKDNDKLKCKALNFNVRLGGARVCHVKPKQHRHHNTRQYNITEAEHRVLHRRERAVLDEILREKYLDWGVERLGLRTKNTNWVTGTKGERRERLHGVKNTWG